MSLSNCKPQSSGTARPTSANKGMCRSTRAYIQKQVCAPFHKYKRSGYAQEETAGCT
jgi:hypothetical protein